MPPAPPVPDRLPHRRRLGRLATSVVVVVTALATLASCATSDFREESSPSSTAAAAPFSLFPVTVAAANDAELEVFATKPGPEGPAPAPEVTDQSGRAPIPRDGLNSASVRKTSTGWVFTNPTYYESPLVNVVTGEEDGWLKVMVAARPNGQEGWVRTSDVTLSQHEFHGELRIGERMLRFWEGDELIVETEVVVGMDVSPTPVGRVFVNEILDTSEIGVSQSTYGPWLLSTSAYSEALDLFDGGLPVIAFHGTGSPELIGTAASNGCVRMPNDVVTLLAETLPAGAPIEILP